MSTALKDPSWQKIGRWACWTNALCFIAASTIFLLVDLEITWTAASYAEGQSFLDRLLEFFAAERDAWPQVLAYTMLFAIGFLALIPIGFTLREYLGRDLASSQMVAASFLSAGIIGTVGQLAFAGGKNTILDASEECLDCEGVEGLLAALDSNLVMLDGIAEWVGLGFFLLAGTGILFASFAAFDQPGVLAKWIQLGMVVGLLYMTGIVADILDMDAVFQVVVGLGRRDPRAGMGYLARAATQEVRSHYPRRDADPVPAEV